LISLNARLLFLPPELVESYLPDYRQLDQQLRIGIRWMPGWLTASCGGKAGKLGVGK
jgi:hypothetical protein